MSRYYFHVHDGEEIRDEIGTELANLDEARQQAIISTGEMLRDYGKAFWSGERWQMYVTDEVGKTVIRLNFSAEFRPSEPVQNGAATATAIEP